MRKNHHALLLISEILDCLTRAMYLIKLDLKDMYHRIPIAEKDCWKTAFCICYKYFEYMVMPFKLTNALAMF
jgi:hypothetical protein